MFITDSDLPLSFLHLGPDGVGVTGEPGPTGVAVVTIQRMSDFLFWDDGNVVWGTGVVLNPMTEVSPTGAPGLWQFDFDHSIAKQTFPNFSTYDETYLASYRRPYGTFKGGAYDIVHVDISTDLLRKLFTNRNVLVASTGENWVVYDGNDSTPLLSAVVLDRNLDTIVMPSGSISVRGTGYELV